MNPNEFITRWQRSGGAELANSQSFLKELCTVLDVAHPDPTQADESQNAYVFEKAVQFNNGDGTFSTGRIDLYRQKCFILESKQGAERKAEEQAEALATVTRNRKNRKGTAARGTPQWAQAMKAAFHQAKRYAEPLPEWPPFLIVCDVGHCFDVYADFSGSGKNYSQFPDPQTCRIAMQSLTNETTREFLRTIWLDPHSLDPAKKSAKVTRELAERLAKLAISLESRGEAGTKKPRGKTRKSPEQTIEDIQDRAHDVAQFLMRCLFTMFAEDVELLPKGSFVALLESLRDQPDQFVPMVEAVWKSMDQGGFSPVLRQKILQFNGGLFADCTALPLNADQLELLIEAAKANWAEVEPSIFGTLLERALNPVERHKLGAHYTPRAYVERLVMPTIMEPLREEWDVVYATATALYNADKVADARKTVREFHEKLCHVRVLDPACGSGNFLYVALELMKKLEGEVTKAMADFGDRQKILTTIDPHQFLGIEVNPRAAAIADLVLWIGYLQWHIRSLGRETIAEPIIRKFDNIECRDAVLAWDRIEPVFDEDGKPVTRWDGRTTIHDSISGLEVPDDSARIALYTYINPFPATWPEAEYIVGNPPFQGNKTMRESLGDGYVDALRTAYTNVPNSVDYVMYWWHNAAVSARQRKLLRFGLITRNTIGQRFNRQILTEHIGSGSGHRLSIRLAIPDHPWVDCANAAAVRIAMTVVRHSENRVGELCCVTSETPSDDGETCVTLSRKLGEIQADLTIGSQLMSMVALRSNAGLACPGVQLSGQGFVLQPDELSRFTKLTREDLIRRYLIGRHFMQVMKVEYVLDTGMLLERDLRDTYPDAYQVLYDRVRQRRASKVTTTKDSADYAKNWWRMAKPRNEFRKSLVGLPAFIVSSRTSRHRVFALIGSEFLPETKILIVASNTPWHLGVLSSKAHLSFADARKGRHGVGNDPTYNHTEVFDPFPFPTPSKAVAERIGRIAIELDSHRKRQQELHPDLTMTGMYNVHEKLRAADVDPACRAGFPAEPDPRSADNGDVSSPPNAGRDKSRSAARQAAPTKAPPTLLTDKERQIHEKGLVSVLKQIHDELDAAVFDAYGWPHDLTDEEILERLVALNHERAEEEKRGLIRWLRPEFQNPDGGKPTVQPELELDGDSDDDSDEDDSASTSGKKKKSKGKSAAKAKTTQQPWPRTLSEQIVAVRSALQARTSPASATDVAKLFKGRKTDLVEELLDTLVTIGHARLTEAGSYVI